MHAMVSPQAVQEGEEKCSGCDAIGFLIYSSMLGDLHALSFHYAD